MDTIKILKQLNFIFCKKVDNGIIIHMPSFIKNKIKKLDEKKYYSDNYKEILSYSKEMADILRLTFLKECNLLNT